MFAQYQSPIPDFTQITDIDKNKFMNKSYGEITNSLLGFLEATKAKNSAFDFDFELVTTKKTIVKLYLNGQRSFYITGISQTEVHENVIVEAFDDFDEVARQEYILHIIPLA